MQAGVGGKDGSNSTERYEFERHHGENWSLEHVNPQSEGHLTGDARKETKKQWVDWLVRHEPYLFLPSSGLSVEASAAWNSTVAEVTRAIREGELTLSEDEFKRLREAIVFHFNKDFSASMNSIQNLALLSREANSSIGNDLFV